MKSAIYCGSFDILTLGHAWMINESLKIADHLFIIVANHPAKKHWFSVARRVELLNEYVTLNNLCNNVTVLSLNSELSYVANIPKYSKDERMRNVTFMIRGIRDSKDFEYESTLKNINESININLSTLFLIPPKQLNQISSSTVKNLIGPHGWQNVIRDYVPENILNALIESR